MRVRVAIAGGDNLPDLHLRVYGGPESQRIIPLADVDSDRKTSVALS